MLSQVRYQAPESPVGNSPAFLKLMEQVSSVAVLERPVLVWGERGTGKELIAERLHFLSSRWDGPLIKLNCAAVHESLLESELFGHEAGAFTGAVKQHEGRFERAHEGTLFLDELTAMPVRMQSKLLRVIEYGEYDRVGGRQTLQCNVRIIAAVNTDLQKEVAEKRFRADLLDRLAFDVLKIPPLRKRGEDIVTLAEYFARKVSGKDGFGLFSGFSRHAVEQMVKHNWPGNVRELKNTVERSVYRLADEKGKVSELVHNPLMDGPSGSAGAWPDDADGLKSKLEKVEKSILSSTLEKVSGNQRKAAQMLELTYDQLRGRLRKYELLPRK